METALRLLAEGRADRLLLSGIGGGAELAELARRAGVDPLPIGDPRDDRTAAPPRPAATRRRPRPGRATTASDSLLVVTASYHMPRALTELARVLPDVDPVSGAGRAAGASRPAAVPLRLMAEEYIKFLASTAGLTAVLPMREPPPVHAGHAG